MAGWRALAPCESLGAVGANVMLLFVVQMHDLLGMTLEEAVYHGDINYFRIIKGFHHLG
jgi:hypothetical protein